MSHDPLVSIIIPCYNAESWIAASIESALDQTYGNTEVLVIDDGSTDGSLNVIKRFNGRVTYLTTPNRGSSAARNVGFRNARGEWIQFLDADDLLHPEKLRLSVATCRRYPEIEFVWAPNLLVSEEFSLNSVRPREIGHPEAELSQDGLDATYAPSAAMLRNSFLRRVGEFNEKLRRWVDLEYHARIAAQVPLYARLPGPLYFYRQHTGAGRISNFQRNQEYINEALESVTVATRVLEGSPVPSKVWRSCYWPFYLHFAMVSAEHGDTKGFQDFLCKAAQVRGTLKFQLKCSVARAVANVIGSSLTAAMIERKYHLSQQGKAAPIEAEGVTQH